LPDDIEWHMIGHLQSNKVKYIAPYNKIAIEEGATIIRIGSIIFGERS